MPQLAAGAGGRWAPASFLIHKNRCSNAGLDVTLELNHHLPPHVGDPALLGLVGEGAVPEGDRRNPVPAGYLPTDVGPHPLRREGRRTPGDHLVVGLAEDQVERHRCLGETHVQRFADLRGDVRSISPEAGDPLGGSERLTNHIRRGVDVEGKKYISHYYCSFISVITKAYSHFSLE